MSSEPQPAPTSAAPLQPPSKANTRFSLRSIFVLTVICAIVAALFRQSPWAFLVFGIPAMVYVAASYALHAWRSSGYICLVLAMLTSVLGFAAYETYEYYYPSTLYRWRWQILAVQAFAFGLIAGFVPIVLEFWLRLVFDGIMWVVRWVMRMFRSESANQQPSERR